MLERVHIDFCKYTNPFLVIFTLVLPCLLLSIGFTLQAFCISAVGLIFFFWFTGVLSVSWYPPGQSDDNGDEWDHHIPLLMDIAASFELKVQIKKIKYQYKYLLTVFPVYM